MFFSSKLNSQPVTNKAQANLSQRSSAKLREEIASVKDELHTTQAQSRRKKVTKIGNHPAEEIQDDWLFASSDCIVITWFAIQPLCGQLKFFQM